MSKELKAKSSSGDTVYFVRKNMSQQVALTDGSSFENWGTGGRDADDYDVAASEIGSNGDFIADFDASGNIAAGRYIVEAYMQLGANPADGDDLIGSSEMVWTGSGELTADKVLANKAVQNKATGAIDYYDDDGITVILTHTPTDAESSITRTPS